MSKNPESSPDKNRPPPFFLVAFVLVCTLGLFATLLFGLAGRLDWAPGWLYLAMITINAGINYAYILRTNPELIASRMRMGKGTKTWDKIWMGAFTPIFLAVYVVAALDAGRYGWSAMPFLLWPLGLALFLPGTILFTWSMAVNPFFEKTVRIHTERGHRVIDTGPYRYVRHPGYVGFVGWAVSAPLLLCSWWAFIPSVLSVIAIFIRTALEDRTLREELPGYIEYASRVRYRLIPLIW